jgi:hypothetical protein
VRHFSLSAKNQPPDAALFLVDFFRHVWYASKESKKRRGEEAGTRVKGVWHHENRDRL